MSRRRSHPQGFYERYGVTVEVLADSVGRASSTSLPLESPCLDFWKTLSLLAVPLVNYVDFERRVGFRKRSERHEDRLLGARKCGGILVVP